MGYTLLNFSKAPQILVISAILCALPALEGCGVLVGNVRPVDQKSQSYGVTDLASTDPDWMKLDAKNLGAEKNEDAATTSTEISDVAFQSKNTASIISINSACRNGNEYKNKDLKSLTEVLLLGASDVTLRDERDLSIQDTPALQTTLQGKINGERVKIRSVVLKRNNCVYDLVYIARPDNFTVHELDFAHFVTSLRLK
jgi:hypothetical protein